MVKTVEQTKHYR